MYNREEAEELIAQYWRDGTVLGSALANQLQAAINEITRLNGAAQIERPVVKGRSTTATPGGELVHTEAVYASPSVCVAGCTCPWCCGE